MYICNVFEEHKRNKLNVDIISILFKAFVLEYRKKKINPLSPMLGILL